MTDARDIPRADRTLTEQRAVARLQQRPRKTRRVGTKRKTVRLKSVRDYALMRAAGVCEISGQAYPWLDVHHARTDAECEALCIVWDSPENVIACRPDEHRRCHKDERSYIEAHARIDTIERNIRRTLG